MIGFFTDPRDSAVVDIVRDAAAQAAPGLEFRVFNLEERPDSEALQSRELLSEIVDMGASVIDGDVRDIVMYAAELGSLAGGMAHFIGRWGRDWHAISDLDR